ncbi:MAG: cytochrome oxidase small assembly protein [Burkholderiales bacterium]
MTDHVPSGTSKSANVRTALVLLSIVAIFFIGVIVNRMML